MTYPELQIQLDLNPDNRVDVLENANTCRLVDYGYLFVDQEDGQCYLFDIGGNLDNIDKVKSIEWNAFFDCRSLKSIEIPSSVESIGHGAFAHCTSLKSIKIPSSVESIGYNTFCNCTSLITIRIPNSMEYIGTYAFKKCLFLKEVVFKGKTMKQVEAMEWYPWGLINESIIKVES